MLTPVLLRKLHVAFAGAIVYGAISGSTVTVVAATLVLLLLLAVLPYYPSLLALLVLLLHVV